MQLEDTNKREMQLREVAWAQALADLGAVDEDKLKQLIGISKQDVKAEEQTTSALPDPGIALRTFDLFCVAY